MFYGLQNVMSFHKLNFNPLMVQLNNPIYIFSAIQPLVFSLPLRRIQLDLNSHSKNVNSVLKKEYNIEGRCTTNFRALLKCTLTGLQSLCGQIPHLFHQDGHLMPVIFLLNTISPIHPDTSTISALSKRLERNMISGED